MTDLNELADGVAGSLLPVARKNRSSFINDIPFNLAVEYNRESLVTMMNGMLSMVLSQARNAVIRLSARKYGYIIVLEVEQEGTAVGSYTDQKLRQIQQLAQKIGGCLDITPKPTGSADSISLSFPNLPTL